MTTLKKRIWAAVIDYSILLVGGACINLIPAGSVWIGPIEFSTMFFVNCLYVPVYIIFKDIVFRNASLAKKLFGLKIVKKSQSTPAVSIILLRNLIEIVPVIFWIDFVLLIGGQEKLADRIFQTNVICVK